MLHYVGVGPGQQGQLGVIFLQIFHESLPSMEHVREPLEGSARCRGFDAAGRPHDCLYRTLSFYLAFTDDELCVCVYLHMVYVTQTQAPRKEGKQRRVMKMVVIWLTL